MKKILVLGATGFVGSAVTRQLLADGFAVRVLARNAEKAKQMLGSQVEVVSGSLEDPAALEKALAGVEGVNLSVAWQMEAQAVQAVTASLARQGRKQVQVSYISGVTVRPENRGYPMVDAKLKAEETLLKSGVAYTILKPNWFMDALGLFVRDGRATLFGKPTQPYAFVALADFARAVSKAHQTEAALNQSIVLNGPQALLMMDALQKYCAVRHPEIKPTSMPIWFGKMLATLLNNASMKDAVQMMAYFEKSPKLCAPTGAEKIVGVPTTTLDMWLAQK